MASSVRHTGEISFCAFMGFLFLCRKPARAVGGNSTRQSIRTAEAARELWAEALALLRFCGRKQYHSDEAAPGETLLSTLRSLGWRFRRNLSVTQHTYRCDH